MINITEQAANWWQEIEIVKNIHSDDKYSSFTKIDEKIMKRYKESIQNSIDEILEEHSQYMTSCKNKTFPFFVQPIDNSFPHLPIFEDVREAILSKNNKNLLDNIFNVKYSIDVSKFSLHCYDSNDKIIAESIIDNFTDVNECV